MLSETTIEKFKANLRGELIQRSDERYEEARKLYNGMIDKRPLLIARCVDVADVITAVNFGRDLDLLIAIRGGGHNGPGLGSCDDGLVIDLSMMKSVRVDPGTRRVRVDPGCTSGDVDHATHAFGLAVPFGIVSTTGVAGLTLGGGHWIPDTEVRPHDRQPARGGRCAGRWWFCHSQPEPAPRSVLGPLRRRW
jgi:FAD/FMN-containing dehydrogenase